MLSLHPIRSRQLEHLTTNKRDKRIEDFEHRFPLAAFCLQDSIEGRDLQPKYISRDPHHLGPERSVDLALACTY